jgi:prepilin-type processing-associated H-X9-DG protein
VKWFQWSFWVFCGLIVVGIVFFPPVGHGREEAKKSACLSSMKNHATAAIIYLSDYDDRFPNRDNWIDATYPYAMKGWYSVVCPEVYKEHNPQLFGYCFNAKLSNAKAPKDATTTPLIFDSVNLARNASGGLDSLPNPGRHEGMNNIAYADGHAKSVKTP